MLDFGFKKSAIDAFTGGREKKNEIFIIRDIEKRKEGRDSTTVSRRHLIFPPAGKLPSNLLESIARWVDAWLTRV